MIAAIEAAGGHPKYTEYPNGGHAIWDQAYTEPQLLPWMFGQTAATISADGGLADVVTAADTGIGATGSGGAGIGTGVDAASPGEAGSSGVGGSSGVPSDDSGVAIEPRRDDTQANGCSCRMAETRRVTYSGYASLLALGVSMRRRRRVGSARAVRR